MKMIRRSFVNKLEVREATDSNITLGGYAVRWGDVADLGWVTEEVKPGAFDDRMDNTFMLIGHNRSALPLARVSNGTMNISEDQDGLRFEATLDKERPDALSAFHAVSRGDADGVSIGFNMDGGKWERDESGGKPHDTIVRVGELIEVSIVAFPAYKASSIEPRELIGGPVVRTQTKSEIELGNLIGKAEKHYGYKGITGRSP